MGYLCRHTIVVAGDEHFNKEVSEVHKKCSEIIRKNLEFDKEVVWLSPISPPMMNHEQYFFISPDGSKEGWSTSDIGDSIRQQIITYLKTTSTKWAEVQFGDDEGQSEVINHSEKDVE